MSSDSPQRATTIDRFYTSLQAQPLVSPAEIEAFYHEPINRIRGADNVSKLQRELTRVHDKRHFLAFLAGHSGCGKSTELTRLARAVVPTHRALRFSAKHEIHPASAKPFDVLIVMMIRLAEEMAKPEPEGLGWRLPEALTNRVLEWFHTETVTSTSGTHAGASAEAGAGMDGVRLGRRS